VAVNKNMRRVPGGDFVMGSDRHYPEEQPAHPAHVDDFWIDEHPVTNAEFRRFVASTGYVTTAETVPASADFPDADSDQLVAGSLVFRQTDHPVPLDDWRRWWQWTPGADWRHPDGPGSTLDGRDRHPAVHVSYEDALAYAAWVDKELPTEAEWEYAARAGSGVTEYAWGDEFMPRGKAMANTWQGAFPWRNDAPSGKDRTTPVGKFPPNRWGVVDMIGNVWEWTTTTWTDFLTSPDAPVATCCAPQNREPEAESLGESDRRVMKGGSHLCAPSYCARYRPAARQGQAIRSSTSHLGFRCIIR
jgi:formylglycine-generating enzyme